MINEIAQAIKTIGDTISEIQVAYDPAPNELITADLPSLWVFTGNSSEALSDSADYSMLVRTMRIQVAVIPTAQGLPRERETRCRPVLDAVATAFRQHPHLGTDWVQSAEIIGDSGIVILPEYSGKFIGFEIQLEVLYYVQRTYALNE